MWKIVAGLVSAVALMQAQAFKDLLFPQARHIEGIVVDSEGKPIANARIDHSNDILQAHQTDTTGRFELDTRAPILVVRKSGYRSELVHTQDAKGMRIPLQQFGEKRTFTTCSKSGSYVGIDGWGATFQFLHVSGVKTSRQGRDIDYGARAYYVETKSGPTGIRHGSGPMWSFGTPSDQDVWRSINYDEITYDFEGLPIMDARGKLSNGRWWRYLGKFGESASYSDVDEMTAKILDKFLDGACSKAISIK
jgi:hypothetical protein